jgi:hypothetical protein
MNPNLSPIINAHRAPKGQPHDGQHHDAVYESMNNKYRKKPIVIEAVKWTGDAHLANSFLGERYDVDWRYVTPESQAIEIPTLEGNMLCNLGDWIIKGIKGEFYPCKPDIFEATYEPAQ